MSPSISPPATGSSTYEVSGSATARFFLDVGLGLGDEAELELHCPTAATVLLLDGLNPPISIPASGSMASNTTPTRTVEAFPSAAGGTSIVLIRITANAAFSGSWQIRVAGVAPPQTAALQINAGGIDITRVLADPTTTATAPAPVLEKQQIALSGGATFTTVPAAPVAGIPDPPPLRARWTQVPPATVSAPPPGTTFSATLAMAPLVANITASPAFVAPAVYAQEQLAYRLTAFYDDDLNVVQGPGEPGAIADVALTVNPRTQHMLLVVDRSGSMAAPMPGTGLTRWEFARRAAHVWADLWMAQRRGMKTGDRAGVTVFEDNNCKWSSKPAAPIELLLPAGGALGGVNDLDVPALNLGTPGACTPIGAALIDAIERFLTVRGGPDDRYVLLLLTDGFENSGPIVVEDDSPVPQGATARFDDQRAVGARKAVSDHLTIYTVGLGPAGTVQDSALHDLTDGPEDRGFYRPVQATELMSAFGEMLGDALESEDITPADPNAAIPVTAGEQRLMFALRWTNANDRMRVYRSVAGGPEEQVSGTGAIATAGITERQRANHGFVEVDLAQHLASPAPTTWRVEYWKNDTTRQPIAAGDLLVMVDLFVKADVRFDRARYATGQRALVTCQISAGGAPVTDARVDVELARPGEGLGTYLGTRGGTYKPGKQSGPDPLAPKAAMLAALLRREDRDGLPVHTPKGIFRDGTDSLWDDGQHRDGPAGDGTYSNTYAMLDKEGTYTWRFTVSGTTPDGNPFARVATRTLWVGVDVDPAASKVQVVGGEHGERRTAEITVRPVDVRGEQLGPFRASEVRITSHDGVFLPFTPPPSDGVVYPQPDKGDLLSRYDGRYTRVLAYDPGTHPVVTVTVQGKRFPDITL